MFKGIRIFFLFLFIPLFSYGEALKIVFNYPLPKNNLQEIYEKTKDIGYIISLLEKTEDFERISYKNRVLYLKRKPVIKKIYISGNKSFWRREILAVTGLLEGQFFEKRTIFNLTRRLKQFYMDKGYPFADVSIDAFINRNGEAVIHIHIKEGKRVKIKKINIYSDIFIPEKLKKDIITFILKKKRNFYIFKLFQFSEYFDFIKFQDRLEKTSDYLKEKGYYDNFLSFYSLEKDKRNYITVNIFVSLGFKYVITFKGNKTFSDKELRKFLTFKEGVNFYQINKSVENIKNFYKNQGFLDVKIVPEYREDFEKNRVFITFHIKEGDVYKISNMDINTDIETLKEELYSFLGKPYSRRKIENLLKKYFFSFYEEGYLSFYYKIKEEINKEDHTVSLFIKVDRGKKFILKEIKIVGGKYPLYIKVPTVYNPRQVLNLLEKIKQYFKDKGYLDAKVFLDARFVQNKNVYVFLHIKIDKSKRYRQGLTFIYGTWHLSPKVIEWNLSKEKYFSKDEFDSELDYFYSLYLFDTVNPYIIEDKKNKKVDKEYIFREDKRGIFQGSIGYNSEQKFKLALQGSLKNLFNYGFEFFGYLETSTLGQTYQLSILNKFVPFRNTVSLSLFRNMQIHRIFDLVERGYKLSLKKKKDKYRSFSLGFEYKDNSLEKQKFFEYKNYLSYKFSYFYKDMHGSPKINPLKGYNFKYGVYLDFGDFSIQKFLTSYRLFHTWKFLTFAPNLSFGYILQKLKKIPPPERFYLGGISNLRGFSYEEVAGKNKKGGKSFLLFNGDIRFPLYKPVNLYGFVFYDMGNVYENFRQLKELYMRNSIGSGIYIPTPAGSFTLYFAYNLNKKDGEDRYRIEFSIAAEF